MRISIDSNVLGEGGVKIKEGVGKNGKPYSIATQVAYLDTGKRYPVECRVRITPEASAGGFREGDMVKGAHEPGDYTIDFERSVYVDQYGGVQVSEELVLVPLGKPEGAKKPAPALA